VLLEITYIGNLQLKNCFFIAEAGNFPFSKKELLFFGEEAV
jgi:hypothetical protein